MSENRDSTTFDELTKYVPSQLKEDTLLTDKLISISEAAEYLSLAKVTLYKMVSAKRIPHIKLNRRVLFSITQLEEWIDEKTVHPIKSGKFRLDTGMVRNIV